MSKLRRQSTGLYPALQTTKGGVRKQLQRTPSHKILGIHNKNARTHGHILHQKQYAAGSRKGRALGRRTPIGRQSRCFITRISKKSQYFSDFIFFFQMLIQIGLSGPLLRKAKPQICWCHPPHSASFTCSRPRASAKCPIPERPSAASASALYLVLVLIS